MVQHLGPNLVKLNGYGLEHRRTEKNIQRYADKADDIGCQPDEAAASVSAMIVTGPAARGGGPANAEEKANGRSGLRDGVFLLFFRSALLTTLQNNV